MQNKVESFLIFCCLGVSKSNASQPSWTKQVPTFTVTRQQHHPHIPSPIQQLIHCISAVTDLRTWNLWATCLVLQVHGSGKLKCALSGAKCNWIPRQSTKPCLKETDYIGQTIWRKAQGWTDNRFTRFLNEKTRLCPNLKFHGFVTKWCNALSLLFFSTDR